jgi:ATPase family associated with various cellular activities (AAA)
MKKKRQVLKININGRIMVDPAIHRRINPNYQVSTVKPKEEEEYFEMSDDSSDESCGNSSNSDVAEQDNHTPSSDESKPRKKFKVVEDENGDHHVVEIKSDDEEEEPAPKENLDSLAQRSKEDSFTDDELLIASPVVLGFAFSEKLWLEFTVSGIRDVEWNEGAYDSLVLPENHKSIVKSLVTSHKFSAAKNIDDVISGKGKGLVAVLHGPPGTGKTLTAEGIAELLKCPLYMVSAGELGTDPRVLERSLTDILDIAHAWGAVLLLDEADVFLEKRSIHDIHRNALVSIFLRLLEYFQGILFLTTNRVETFDDAFQSRTSLTPQPTPPSTHQANKIYRDPRSTQIRRTNQQSQTIRLEDVCGKSPQSRRGRGRGVQGIRLRHPRQTQPQWTPDQELDACGTGTGAE